jgi:hypothetical protein
MTQADCERGGGMWLPDLIDRNWGGGSAPAAPL